MLAADRGMKVAHPKKSYLLQDFLQVSEKVSEQTYREAQRLYFSFTSICIFIIGTLRQAILNPLYFGSVGSGDKKYQTSGFVVPYNFMHQCVSLHGSVCSEAYRVWASWRGSRQLQEMVDQSLKHHEVFCVTFSETTGGRHNQVKEVLMDVDRMSKRTRASLWRRA